MSNRRPPLNLLVAYPYLKKDITNLIAKRKDEIRLVVDSGAFTAWKSGKTIDVGEYCNFIESLPVKPWKFFALDVIGDAKGTMKNYEFMLRRGLNPVPIFTRGEDPSVLEDYYKTSDVVAIGGLVGTPGNRGFVKGIMNLVGTRKCHWLGFTNLPFLKVFKPYMADSSSWESGACFGFCPVYLGLGQPVVIINRKNILRHLSNPAVVNSLDRYGFKPIDFSNPRSWSATRGAARLLGALSYRRLSEDVGKNLGTNLFLACTTKNSIELLLDG